MEHRFALDPNSSVRRRQLITMTIAREQGEKTGSLTEHQLAEANDERGQPVQHENGEGLWNPLMLIDEADEGFEMTISTLKTNDREDVSGSREEHDLIYH